MAGKRAWLTNPATGEKYHAWSHVKSVFYNKAANILLKDKLDEMDTLIDEKIKKAMMSNIQINDRNKVPTSALAFDMQKQITSNKTLVDQLNRDMQSGIDSLKQSVNGALDSDPVQGIKDAWDSLTDGLYLLYLVRGAVYGALVLRLNGGQYGAAHIISYGLEKPIFLIKNPDGFTTK